MTTRAMLPAKSSDRQAISKTDWLSTHIADTSAYLAWGQFEDPQIQTSWAMIVIGKNIDKPDAATIH
jgi:hypothetical protein